MVANSLLHSLARDDPESPTDASSGADGEGGPLEETVAVAPDGTEIKCYFRGVDPSIPAGTKEWRKAKRLADNRASAARSRALQRIRVTDMSQQVAELVAANKRLQEENARLRAALSGNTAGTAARLEADVAADHKNIKADGRGRVARVPRGNKASARATEEPMAVRRAGDRFALSRTNSMHSRGTYSSGATGADADVSSSDDADLPFEGDDSDALSVHIRTRGTAAAQPQLLDGLDEDVEMAEMSDFGMSLTASSAFLQSVDTLLGSTGTSASSRTTSPASQSSASTLDVSSSACATVPLVPYADLLRECSMASVLTPSCQPMSELSTATGVPLARLPSLSLSDCFSPVAAPPAVASPAFSLAGIPFSSAWEHGLSSTAGCKRRADADASADMESSGLPTPVTTSTGAVKKGRPWTSMMMMTLAVIAAVYTACPMDGGYAAVGAPVAIGGAPRKLLAWNPRETLDAHDEMYSTVNYLEATASEDAAAPSAFYLASPGPSVAVNSSLRALNVPFGGPTTADSAKDARLAPRVARSGSPIGRCRRRFTHSSLFSQPTPVSNPPEYWMSWLSLIGRASVMSLCCFIWAFHRHAVMRWLTSAHANSALGPVSKAT